jgi:hypothetical protein
MDNWELLGDVAKKIIEQLQKQQQEKRDNL